MKIAVLTSRYPKKGNPYNHMFVHLRNKEYLKKGLYVEVFVPSSIEESYIYEGVKVNLLPSFKIIKALSKFDIAFIHLLHPSYKKALDGYLIYKFLIEENFPILFFLHGIEVQKFFKDRRENINWFEPISIAKALYHDFYKFPKIKKVIKQLIQDYERVRFITISKWFLRNIEENLSFSIKNKTVIIPNGIDTKLFTYKNRWKNRYKVLTIRPLQLKGKYAVELAINTFKYIKNPQVNLTIIGKGKDAKKIKSLINSLSLQEKINLIETFVEHTNLPKIHSKYGLYYAVTKMDAQGVSMCEAMASGLPVISFKIAAIPEFIEHLKTGILVNPFNLQEAAEWIDNLVEDYNLYLRLSENARKFIETIDISKTTDKELQVAKEILK